MVEVRAERASRPALAGLALAVALALPACSSDEPDGSTPDRPSPAPTQSTPESPAEQSDQSDQSATAAPEQQLVAPRPARNAADLARRVVAAEDAVRDARSSEAEVAQAAFDTQILYRQLARRPAWHDDVLAAVGRHRAAVADHLEARESLRSVLTTLSSQLPAWRIVRPAPSAELKRYYRKGERVHGVPWEVLAAVNLVETGFGKIRGFSSAGARGPMQFIPSTWEAYGEGDIDDPHDSIMAAARYLAANGGDRRDGLDGALHAYNRHDGYVRGVRAYARIIERDPAAYETLYRWQILYLSTRGDIWLPIGYRQRESIPVDRYLRRHPDRLLGTE